MYDHIHVHMTIKWDQMTEWFKQAGAELGQAQVKLEVVDEVLAEA